MSVTFYAIGTPQDTADSTGPGTYHAEDERRPWSTPVVIVAEMRHAGAQVALGSDGTDSDAAGYQYGS